jgi:hypothetical protein
MQATTTTRELFPKSTFELSDVQKEQQLRIKAGAIRSTIDQTSDARNYILITEWNVLGENDPASVI